MKLKEFYKKYAQQISSQVVLALKEDKVNRDLTTELLLSGKPGQKTLKASLVCKEDCILAGLDIFKKVYKQISPNVKFKSYYKDGDKVKNRERVLTVTSSLRNLLAGERTALNFLQRMSGIATLTNNFVSRLKYKGSAILHTRKTTPNFRLFEIAAVKTGGGDFHRIDLSSAVMIKDNHIESLGNIQNVMDYLNSRKVRIKRTKNISAELEIEAKNMNEVKTIIKYGKGIVKTVMLDNFTPKNITEAIKSLKLNRFKIELSGGINEKNFDRLQHKGIDFYSIGEMTHSYKSIDFSLEF